jgi:hypothetical protein
MTPTRSDRRGELAKRLVLRVLASGLYLAWVTADAAYGQEGRFRRLLEQSGLGYAPLPGVPLPPLRDPPHQQPGPSLARRSRRIG